MKETVTIWDAATGQPLTALSKRRNTAWTRLAFRPDGRQLGANGIGLDVWDLAAGREAVSLHGHGSLVHDVAFSPDGRRLASASSDHTVKVWDMPTGTDVLTLRGHTVDVRAVAFRPDGHLLASASIDGTVKVWDARPVGPKPDRFFDDETGNLMRVRVLIEEVLPSSEAERQGLQAGDVILAYEGSNVLSAFQFASARKAESKDGGLKPLEVRRDGRVLTVHVGSGQLGVRLSEVPVPE
jgi:WD40 repeat protein